VSTEEPQKQDQDETQALFMRLFPESPAPTFYDKPSELVLKKELDWKIRDSRWGAHGNEWRGLLIVDDETREKQRGELDESAAFHARLQHQSSEERKWDLGIGKEMTDGGVNGHTPSYACGYADDAMRDYMVQATNYGPEETPRIPHLIRMYFVIGSLEHVAKKGNILAEHADYQVLDPVECFGRSLVSATNDAGETFHDAVFSEIDNAGGRTTMIRTGRHKMVISAMTETLQLFDMQKDPRELRNLAGREDMMNLEQQLKGAILTWRLETETVQSRD
jgi:hypothetical protein